MKKVVELMSVPFLVVFGMMTLSAWCQARQSALCAEREMIEAAACPVARSYCHLTLQELRELSTVGDSAASFEIGRRYDEGDDEMRDPNAAAEWYRVAEEQGEVLPDDILARFFEHP